MRDVYFNCKCGKKAYNEISCDCGLKMFYCKCNTLPKYFLVCNCGIKFKIDNDRNAIKVCDHPLLPYVARRAGWTTHDDEYGLMLNVFGSGNTPQVQVKLLSMIMRPEDIQNFLRCVTFMSWEMEKEVDFRNIKVIGDNLKNMKGLANKEKSLIKLDYGHLNDNDITSTYIHEVIHHYQFQNNLLNIVDEKYLSWFGEFERYIGLKWSDRPWEQDAIRGQEVFFHRFKHQFSIRTTIKEISEYYAPLIEKMG